MAETSVDLLMENLKELMKSKIDLILDEKDQIESLYQEFGFLRSFLKDWEDKLCEAKEVSNMVRRIRDLANEVEDTIDLLVVEASLKDTYKSGKVDHVCDLSLNLGNFKEEIEAIKTELTEIYSNKSHDIGPMQERKPSRGDFSRAKSIVGEEEIVVGFEDEALTIKDRLTRDQKQLDTISIVGMPGLGKTTLAKKVYNDPLIIYHFHIRAWINVSQEYRKRDVLLSLFYSISPHTSRANSAGQNSCTSLGGQGFESGDMQNSPIPDYGLRWAKGKKEVKEMSDEELADKLRKSLKGKRYLIVMDDIWDTRAWIDLKSLFPNDNNGSRIMFTSRFTNVALHANTHTPPLFLSFLTEDESWDLFKKKVFRTDWCPPELMSIGKKVVIKCQGLPLAIVVVSGIFANIEKSQDQWKQVGEIRDSCAVRDLKLCMETFALSYNHLPHHLKSCFLYFAAFPKDFEIPVWKLTQLWVAEGFIRNIGESSLEDVAEEYLMDLIGRNLILVSKRRSDGRIKACSVHALLHDFCLKKAEEEYFLQQILCLNFFFSSSTSKHCSHVRRLCFGSNTLRNTYLIPSGLNIRSCLCFLSNYIGFDPHLFLSHCFKLLRVLDMIYIDFTAYPSEIEQLVLLRYLALDILWNPFTGEHSRLYLPTSISNLRNLETLILRTSVAYVSLPRSIWKMVKLRHILVSGRGIFVIQSLCRNDHFPLSLDNLQTLSCVDPWSCKDIFLAGTPNLKKLDFHGAIFKCLEMLKFPDISCLNYLQKLKLCSKDDGLNFNDLRSVKFPPNLKQLTLKGAYVECDEVSILGKLLPNLEVLKLSGIYEWEWACDASEVFPRLKILKLEGWMIGSWQVSCNYFPSLQRLVLSGFQDLDIPSQIGDIPTLQIIEVRRCYHSVVKSARKIKEEQNSMGNNWLQIIESDNVPE
ncbi:putative late blight resistance protein homolog R1A-3 [Camellia sinensis]|nr:putative late blight resistance protein homolog R1A-3 [Camellia sinensis]XP_028124913.1 putative late blight resistance protein homolog R1A-3 [Camellia sinensis]XP_028124915.1 putative late blight resistance protein homolog R1A-3 [Camellia sinensis]XP_028124916.1 putative late blight resistance protein homolog R1A-3 [Camellia sinensis]XP_028124917.1 putative late blight resistance protein homolog R1A-3 [Camellia sinensis]